MSESKAASPEDTALARLRAWGEGRRDAGADFTGARLINADLSGLDLSGADLSGADLTNATLQGCRFAGTKLVGTTFHGADIRDAEFLAANLAGADLSECEGGRASFGGADLSGARLFDSRFQGGVFSGAKMPGVDIRAANLQGARLRDVDLSNSDFSRCNLREADLEGCSVVGAKLDGSTLCGAHLKGMKGFRQAAWIGVDLRDVDFSGAYLLRRFVMDQNYLFEFRRQGGAHELVYKLWWLTSDCGRSLARWGIWCFCIALLFAGIYSQLPVAYGDYETALSPLYYSVVTLTTLGYGDALPASTSAQIACMVEVILGYVMLGGLLSIFANKMSRRAE
jgi:uncharacterized protein YjbI with pentapeptide repeats